ncbi:helix-turn-helix domain-containing protein [Hydrogenophaga laconesensis]|uniref:DNA-binding transcriptional regulator YdaS (Cro superfamily) n=1 Tax=Hydrogenophaga laconesensis TaxID=1805971 RepID=A0ABU1VDI6_9BURK|nr:helix-turn-helix transcriptional regulator [Hydrogenophaga laconesensis]MDR7095524.1 DNA-binding transcriptional regulator YdaS (Cro superfamily) [Hydrogenophaga laconesensis]
MKSDELSQLIALAAAQHGNNKSELARQLGVSPQTLNHWETGKIPCPPERVALIAAAGNLPPDQWLTRAVLWKHDGTDLGERLKVALGKPMRAIGAALVLCIAVALAGHFGKAESGLFRRA